MTTLRWVMIALLVAGCDSDQPASAGIVRADFGRIGEVQVGMSQEELESTAGAEFAAGYEITAEEESCYYLRSEKKFPGAGFMMDRNRLVRIDFWDPAIRTNYGLGVGSEESAVEAAYNNEITIAPHKYTDGHYLIVDGADGLKLVFETDAGAVTKFRTGRDPEVGFVEGCL